MNRLQKASVLTDLVDKLAVKGSWCGETNIQKATYFLQDLVNVPTSYEYILYTHGPFSFDLRDELTELRADGLLQFKVCQPYGPKWIPTSTSQEVRQRHSVTLNRFQKQIEFVANEFGPLGVGELERLGTALYFIRKNETSDAESAKKIHAIKPHIGVSRAEDALKKMREIITRAEPAKYSPPAVPVESHGV
jgi:hypothetical protein